MIQTCELRQAQNLKLSDQAVCINQQTAIAVTWYFLATIIEAPEWHHCTTQPVPPLTIIVRSKLREYNNELFSIQCDEGQRGNLKDHKKSPFFSTIILYASTSSSKLNFLLDSMASSFGFHRPIMVKSQFLT